MPCNTERCKAACCRIISLQYPMLNSDTRRWLNLHGVETRITEAGTHLKIPLQCTALTADMKCSLHETDKPKNCRVYPTKESPWIPREICSMLGET